MTFGIDVSRYQQNVDWNKVKDAGASFAIIRIGYRGYGSGALVLSEFTGAAAELRRAYKCNPHDLDGVKDAIELAVNDDPEERRRRMTTLRRQVLTNDVTRWARQFLKALGGEELSAKV